MSPKVRAIATFDLMFGSEAKEMLDSGKARFSNDLVEWDYGDYEGLRTKEIRDVREKRGLDGKGWDHFRDGCEGGEYASLSNHE